ncbi:MAG TPA: 2-hydroxychromene-2-carboxylate isomerase [Anaeromyxobacteraceae bacterium]|nr:2-hydroxychromene-2-carboxylate isomerase [Anaeromyxobacteraceae bacterium]
MADLEFFYDFVSPYSYLASTRIEAEVRRAGGAVRFRPFLLGAVFKATGNRAPLDTPAKEAHMWVDLQRWSRRLGVPLVRPATFPVLTVLPLRAALAAEKAGALVPFTHAVYRAYWVEGRDISQAEVVEEAARRAGLDGPALVAAAPGYKEALARQTQEAVDRGAFGAPTYFVGGEMFVGNDRLDFAIEALVAANRP